jgi:hypothetical protein
MVFWCKGLRSALLPAVLMLLTWHDGYQGGAGSSNMLAMTSISRTAS